MIPSEIEKQLISQYDPEGSCRISQKYSSKDRHVYTQEGENYHWLTISRENKGVYSVLDRSRCQALFLNRWGIQSVRAGFYFYARDPGPGMDGLLWTGGGSRRCMGGIQKKEDVCKTARRDYPEGQTEEDGRCHGNP